MSKDIKDYLHLYLGCEVEWGYKKKKGFLVGKVEPFGWQIFDPSSVFVPHHNVREELLKPLLRPLSDMTEEEKKEISYDVYKIIRQEMPKKTGIEVSATWSAKQTAYLLKQGFDLFGLIESGLAIDKTKIYTHDTNAKND